MAKFDVLLERPAYEVVNVTIEAETPEAACDRVRLLLKQNYDQLGGLSRAGLDVGDRGYQSEIAPWEVSQVEELDPVPDTALEEGCRYERALGDASDLG
jgi:hypothetical protein